MLFAQDDRERAELSSDYLKAGKTGKILIRISWFCWMVAIWTV